MLARRQYLAGLDRIYCLFILEFNHTASLALAVFDSGRHYNLSRLIPSKLKVLHYIMLQNQFHSPQHDSIAAKLQRRGSSSSGISTIEYTCKFYIYIYICVTYVKAFYLNIFVCGWRL